MSGWVLVAVAATVGVTVAGCSSASAGSVHHSGTPAASSALLVQLNALPTVEGAARTAQHTTATVATRTYRVPAGTPACLQILARLDAGGYEVVTGEPQQPVVSATCQAAVAAAHTSESSGSGEILAAGGSQIALSWTSTSYTVTAASS